MRPMIALSGLLLVGSLFVYAAAADREEVHADGVSTEQLLRRIARLEQRVAALEGSSRPIPPQPYAQPYAPTRPNRSMPTLPPNNRPNFQMPRANPPASQPPQPLPKGWQRFEFNGSYFYIIPVDDVAKTTTQY